MSALSAAAPATPTVAGSDERERRRRARRPSLGVGVLVAEGGISPRPAGTYHHRLEVILAGKAGRDGTVVLAVIIDLLAGHGPASDEALQRFLGKRAGMPLTIIASLALLRCVDAEQPHKLRAKLYSITVYDLEARLCGRSDDGVVVGFRVSRRRPARGQEMARSMQFLPAFAHIPRGGANAYQSTHCAKSLSIAVAVLALPTAVVRSPNG